MSPQLLSLRRVVVLACLWFGGGSAVASITAVFEDTMAQRTRACTHCHGEAGRAGTDGYYPRLAGKPVIYLYNQLLNIRDGRRHYPLMAHLLEPLTDAYLMEFAQYFSGLNVAYPAPKPTTASKAVMDRGFVLVTQGDSSRQIPPCQQCHGKALTGAAPHVPGLLGLPRDYLNAQLGGWRTGQRRAQSPDCMAHIASRLDAQDLIAVTHWLAAQPLPADTKPLTELPALPAGAKEMRCGSASLEVKAPAAKLAPLATHGAYLARIGNCETCHTAAGGKPYAGQRPIETPFGTAYSSNLTPDKVTGLGDWSADDFWQALHHGKSRDGRLLSPAFPYTNYTQVTRADSDALYAYFLTLPAVSQVQRAHDMNWPFGTQAALWIWRNLFFNPQVFVSEANRSEEWNRGAYLVNGLTHCSSCHTPRNLFGATQESTSLMGGLIPVQNWYAPSLITPREGGVNPDDKTATQALLRNGLSPQGLASGPMALVVQGGTQYLTDADLRAVVSYLHFLSKPDKSMQEKAPQPMPNPPTPASPAAALGSNLYGAHCADCHGKAGQGVAGAYPALAGNRAVVLADTSNLIQTVLHGGFAPATAGNPRPYGMPPFVLHLNALEIAQILTFVRNAWGNQAGAVTEQQVNRLRDRQTH